MRVDEAADPIPGIVGLGLVVGRLSVEEAVRGVRLDDDLLLDARRDESFAELLDRGDGDCPVRAAEHKTKTIIVAILGSSSRKNLWKETEKLIAIGFDKHI